MKNVFHKTLSMIPMLALLTGLSACLKEKTDDCMDPRGNVRVVIRLDDQAAASSAYVQDIQSVHLYVFDDNDKLIRTVDRLSPYEHGHDYEIWLDLEQGKYHFVAWTNLGDCYSVGHVSGVADLVDSPSADLRLAFGHPSDVTDDMDDLHFGNHRDAVVVAGRTNVFPVELIPNTNLIRVTVLGLPQTADNYLFTIGDNNCHYTFDNAFALHTGNENGSFRYVRDGSPIDDTLVARFKILKLSDERTPAFKFTNTSDGQILFSNNLVGMIQRAYAIGGQSAVDFDRTHVFDLTLTFDINMNVSISVNGWQYTQQSGDLG